MLTQQTQHQSGRTEAETIDIDCNERSSAAFFDASRDFGNPPGGPVARLTAAMRDLVRLHRDKGWSTMRLRRLAFAFVGVIEDLDGPPSPEMRETVRRHESMKDAREQMAQDDRLIHGDSSYRKREHLRTLYDDAAATLAYCRVLEWEIRQEESDKQVAIHRCRER